MARKLPWVGEIQPPKKRQRTIETPIKLSPTAKPQETDAESVQSVHGRTPLLTPPKKRARSRSLSTSPPPAPPDVEPMLKGHHADDAWMMVEDEFQTLAQTFTRHLHHAEYKRLEKKAKEAPRKTLPEPVSPMSKKTKQKLERAALAGKQQDSLNQIILGQSTVDVNTSEDAKVEDPWRGTHLAGLMATSSQGRQSLKGLERMPSSTKAAKGYSRDVVQQEEDRQISATNHILGGSFLQKKYRLEAKARTKKYPEDQREPQPEQEDDNLLDAPRPPRRSLASPVREVPAERSMLNSRRRDTVELSPPNKNAPRQPSSLLKKSNQVKAVSREDRLAEVPMFLG